MPMERISLRSTFRIYRPGLTLWDLLRGGAAAAPPPYRVGAKGG